MLVNILVAEGYEICAEAANATEAIDKYRKYKPDLVTMDKEYSEINYGRY
jgi:chemotaxis response regulator CheB